MTSSPRAPRRVAIPDFCGRPLTLSGDARQWEAAGPEGGDCLLLGLGPEDPAALPFAASGRVFWLDCPDTRRALPDAPLPPICDEKIPLWFLVYHGILSYNPTCETVNSAIRTDDPDPELRMVEYGGRPFAYFYSKFLSSGVNWMGEQDCTAATDEEMRWCVSRIREQYDRYRELRDLQFEFMERYETLAENVALITYSGGSVLLVNRSDQTYDDVPPHSYRRRNSR